ncbi:Protein MAIN-LIKE 2 [Linum perenne]
MDYMFGDVPEGVSVGPSDPSILWGDNDRHRAALVFDAEEPHMTHTCRNSKKIVDYDPRFESILLDIGLDKLRDALKLTPDPELITALVERWRPETNTFHLYGGEATITLEDVHFITGLSVDGLPVTSPKLIPTDLDELCDYVESQLGKKPATSDVLLGRIKMTWLRSHFAYREGAISDDDIHTIHQYCRAYIVDYFGNCIFANRSGAYAHLFMFPLLEDIERVGERHSTGLHYPQPAAESVI